MRGPEQENKRIHGVGVGIMACLVLGNALGLLFSSRHGAAKATMRLRAGLYHQVPIRGSCFTGEPSYRHCETLLFAARRAGPD